MSVSATEANPGRYRFQGTTFTSSSNDHYHRAQSLKADSPGSQPKAALKLANRLLMLWRAEAPISDGIGPMHTAGLYVINDKLSFLNMANVVW
jgi:hypothetical protein